MENELKSLMGEVLKDEYYVSKIKEALKDKIIETIKYDFSAIITEAIKELFTTEYKKELADIVIREKETIKNTMKERISELIQGLSQRIELNVSNWDFEKLLKEAIDVKDLKK